MSNVLSEQKRQQVLALGRLGWPLRRIEEESRIRRETAAPISKRLALRATSRTAEGGVVRVKIGHYDARGVHRAMVEFLLEKYPHAGRPAWVRRLRSQQRQKKPAVANLRLRVALTAPLTLR